MKNHDKGAEKKDRYGAQVAVEPDGSRPEGMKNPSKRISRVSVALSRLKDLIRKDLVRLNFLLPC